MLKQKIHLTPLFTRVLEDVSGIGFRDWFIYLLFLNHLDTQSKDTVMQALKKVTFHFSRTFSSMKWRRLITCEYFPSSLKNHSPGTHTATCTAVQIIKSDFFLSCNTENTYSWKEFCFFFNFVLSMRKGLLDYCYWFHCLDTILNFCRVSNFV